MAKLSIVKRIGSAVNKHYLKRAGKDPLVKAAVSRTKTVRHLNISAAKTASIGQSDATKMHMATQLTGNLRANRKAGMANARKIRSNAASDLKREDLTTAAEIGAGGAVIGGVMKYKKNKGKRNNG